LILLITICLSHATRAPAAPSEGGPAFAAQDTLKQYIEELKTNPANIALREMIITLAPIMKPAPTIPEIAERHLSRGTAFMNEAAGAGGYNQAIVEFEAAANSATWLAVAYFTLASIQEKVGFYTEAIQGSEFYLTAKPNATNSRT
jgi:hypothetical protein